jgi:hypothetical protein
MTTISTAIEIPASPDRVYAVITDIDRWHEWTPSISSVKRIDGNPFAVGTRVLIKQPKLPPALWTIDSIDPGKGFTWVSRAPGLRVTGIHTVEPAGTGSRAVLGLHYEGVLGALLARMTRGITERYIAFEAQGLKARSENPAFRHSTPG